ncbi:PE-PGRS family protein [Streptomyces sp. NPDC060031]|uniref:PE-PGRS family protein n=1 Tax=Streptomyces sp. NPDC060031 TaxID=3347043 RepID=UPI0036A02593
MTDTDAIAEMTSEDAAGVVGLGVSGVAGYARPAPRDVDKEREARAGVLGIADNSENSTGVAGFGAVGVAGRGSECGVRGRSEATGVRGETLFGEGVLGEARATGVGVIGMSKDGNGIRAQSETDAGIACSSFAEVGGRFSSVEAAQIELAPHPADTRFGDAAPRLPGAGRLGQLITLSDADGACRLYLCVGAPEGATAKWAPVQLGDAVDGRPS